MSLENEEKKTTLQETALSEAEDARIVKAHEQAEADIQKDPDLAIGPEKGDDLDEGELAQLEGEE